MRREKDEKVCQACLLPLTGLVPAMIACWSALCRRGHVQDTFPLFARGSHNKFGDLMFPACKLVARMLTKLRDDYAGLPEPCDGVLDSLRLSVVSASRTQQRDFLRPLTTGQMAEMTPIRCKSTMNDPSALLKYELWNFLFVATLPLLPPPP